MTTEYAKKMQLDVDIEPTLRIPHMISINNRLDEPKGSFSPVHGARYNIFQVMSIYLICIYSTDRKKVHRWAQKLHMRNAKVSQEKKIYVQPGMC